MTAEEYIKHYTSGQGGFESVSVDVALEAIKYAKQEAREDMMKDAIPANILTNQYGNKYIQSWSGLKQYDKYKNGDNVKLIIIKEE